MKDPYVCICCGYETFHRSSMYNHFYKKKKPCPKTRNDIELTEEIKQYILNNRIYNIPKEKQEKTQIVSKKKLNTYTCFSCGYMTNQKNEMCNHFNKPCQQLLTNDKMTDAIKNNILDNQFLPTYTLLINTIKKLRLELQYFKNKKSEKFFQLILEEYLCGTHCKVDCGVTDITTEDSHCEIKEWHYWKHALGQLVAYSKSSSKKKLKMFCFGKCKDKMKETALDICLKSEILLYDIIVNNNKVDVLDMQNRSIIYTKVFEKET